MKSMLMTGLAIGVLCAAWQVIMILAGWLTKPGTFALFYLVILIQILILIWGMRQTAQDCGYGGQLGIGTGASLVAGVFLFLYSITATTILFPGLIGEMRAMQAQALQNAG
jgi:hypothetical protein